MLEILLLILGISAFYGGVQLIRDAFEFPVDWLDPLPFDSWVVPGLLLMALIGVPSFAVLGTYVAGNRIADRLAILLAVIVMVWIAVQLLFVPFYWLQPLVFAVAACILLLAVARIRDA